MGLSNKSLALMLLSAIIISLGGTLISMNKIADFQKVTFFPPQVRGVTGAVTSPGYVNLSLSNVVGCTLDNSAVDCGASTGQKIELSSEVSNTGAGFNDCSSGTTVCTGLQLNNTGNVWVNVTHQSNLNATGLMGGNDVELDDFEFTVKNGTDIGNRPGCFNNSQETIWTSYINVPLTRTNICRNLTFQETNDQITFEYNVTVISSTPSGTKNATITIECLQV